MRSLTLPKNTPMHVVQRIQAAFKRRSRRERRKSAPNVVSTSPASSIAALVGRHPWLGLDKFENKYILKQEATARNHGC